MQGQAVPMAAAPQPPVKTLCRQTNARLLSTPHHSPPLRAHLAGNPSTPCPSSRCREVSCTGRSRARAEGNVEALRDADAQSVRRRQILTEFPLSAAVGTAAALLPLARPVSAQEEAALEEGAVREPLETDAPGTSGAVDAALREVAEEAPSSSASSGAEPVITSRVYLDISIEGAQAGRIVIGLYGNVSAHGRRGVLPALVACSTLGPWPSGAPLPSLFTMQSARDLSNGISPALPVHNAEC